MSKCFFSPFWVLLVLFRTSLQNLRSQRYSAALSPEDLCYFSHFTLCSICSSVLFTHFLPEECPVDPPLFVGKAALGPSGGGVTCQVECASGSALLYRLPPPLSSWRFTRLSVWTWVPQLCDGPSGVPWLFSALCISTETWESARPLQVLQGCWLALHSTHIRLEEGQHCGDYGIFQLTTLEYSPRLRPSLVSLSDVLYFWVLSLDGFLWWWNGCISSTHCCL